MIKNIICKIENGNDDGDWNSFTGTSVQRDFIKIGKWATIDSYGLFRFKLPINQGILIKKAMLTIYIEEYKDFLEEDPKPVEIWIDVSDEIDAKSLRFGMNRSFIVPEKYRMKLETNSFVDFNITKKINKIINKKDWKKDNYILLRVKINKISNQLWNISSADENLFGSAQVLIRMDDNYNEINEKVKINDELICLNSNPENEDYRLGDIVLHPNHLSVNCDSIINPYHIINSDLLSITLTEKISYEIANEMLELVGKTVPFFTPEFNFNCVVQSCNLNYNIGYVNLTLNLIVF